MALEIPIAFCIYNRPECTAKTFQAIRRQRPEKLLVISDGPKRTKPLDRELVARTRDILRGVDWNCEVTWCAAPSNLGCRQRMASGLDWAFQREERLIVLEDDCLANDSFFCFVETMLEQYANNEQVMMVSGDRFVPTETSNRHYYFSRWNHIWGWASWRRAWKHYDVDLQLWPEIKAHEFLKELVDIEEEFQHWTKVFDRVHEGTLDTWDFSWMFACWINRGLTIIPPQNLVSNIGFGPEATHTSDPHATLAKLPTLELSEWIEPEQIQRDVNADRWTYEKLFSPTVIEPEVEPSKTWWRKKWWRFNRKSA